MKYASHNQESKRPYRSPMRQRQAQETRQRILGAARELLTTQGYVGMTMEAIGEAAEVSPKTVAAVVGYKREILAEIVNPDAFEAPVKSIERKDRHHGSLL
jgi:AcrR family transcriptional regulator